MPYEIETTALGTWRPAARGGEERELTTSSRIVSTLEQARADRVSRDTIVKACGLNWRARRRHLERLARLPPEGAALELPNDVCLEIALVLDADFEAAEPHDYGDRPRRFVRDAGVETPTG